MSAQTSWMEELEREWADALGPARPGEGPLALVVINHRSSGASEARSEMASEMRRCWAVRRSPESAAAMKEELRRFLSTPGEGGVSRWSHHPPEAGAPGQRLKARERALGLGAEWGLGAQEGRRDASGLTSALEGLSKIGLAAGPADAGEAWGGWFFDFEVVEALEALAGALELEAACRAGPAGKMAGRL